MAKLKPSLSGEITTLDPDKKNFWREHQECCDCGLVHLNTYRRLANGNLEVVAFRDRYFTKKARKKKK